LRFEFVAQDQLEHEQNDVRVEADKHGFELHKVVSFESSMFHSAPTNSANEQAEYNG